MVQLVVLDYGNCVIGHRIVSPINRHVHLSTADSLLTRDLVKGRALLDLDVYALSTSRSGYHPSHNTHLVNMCLFSTSIISSALHGILASEEDDAQTKFISHIGTWVARYYNTSIPKNSAQFHFNVPRCKHGDGVGFRVVYFPATSEQAPARPRAYQTEPDLL
jgi:hypothetical protein